MKKNNLTDNLKVEEIRINKFISEKGVCSRREADKLISLGKVTINGEVATMGSKVTSTDEVKLEGNLLSKKPKQLYMALNKPKGIVSTTDPKEKNNIVNFINYPERIFHIGRLDKDSEGLIFLTNDGDIVNKILRAGNNHEKEYIVTVDKPLTQDFLQRMCSGVRILGTVTKPCKIYKEGSNVFRIILTQGLNRQIRRMCQALGYTVTKLKRIRIMNVKLDNLPLGKWRYLTNDEINTINELLKNSTKTEEASK